MSGQGDGDGPGDVGDEAGRCVKDAHGEFCVAGRAVDEGLEGAEVPFDGRGICAPGGLEGGAVFFGHIIFDTFYLELHAGAGVGENT